MAEIRPFACWLPTPAWAAEVAALPYDVFSRSEAAAEIAAHPHSFLRIDKSCALLPEFDEYDPTVYAKAAQLLDEDRANGVFVAQATPRYYLYRLASQGHSQVGLVATIATDDYRSNTVRRHENTRQHKLEDRVRHIEALKAQTGPILLAYRAQSCVDALIAQQQKTKPLFDFTSSDGVNHTVWRIDNAACKTALTEAFAAVNALYIADGHHRAAAAAEVGGEYFLGILFPSDQLRILDYNRVVTGLGGLTPAQILQRIEADFEVEKVGVGAEAALAEAGAVEAGAAPVKPRQRGEFALYLGTDTWYRLRLRAGRRPQDAVAGLDVSLLHNLVLGPVLGIEDPRSDPRIAYVGGSRGLDELRRRVDALQRPADDRGAAFALYPVGLDELFAVADAGRLMPPKSTWFDPKPRSGLFIYDI